AEDFQVPAHFFGVTTRPTFLPFFLMLFGVVLVLTVPVAASGALGSVLIGGIVQSRLYPPAILHVTTNVGPRSGNTYTRTELPPLKIVSFALTGSVTTGFA